MKYTILSLETEEQLCQVDRIDAKSGSTWKFIAGKATTEISNAQVLFESEQIDVAIAGERYVFPAQKAHTREGAMKIATALGTFALVAERGFVADAGAGAGSGRKTVKSSMPGKVIQILCKPGDRIEAGQPLLIIEAMKMENEIRAQQGGVVEEIPVQVGQKVETGGLLIVIGAGE